jgi:hypothetical protein
MAVLETDGSITIVPIASRVVRTRQTPSVSSAKLA